MDIKGIIERLRKRKEEYEEQARRIQTLLNMGPDDLLFFVSEIRAIEDTVRLNVRPMATNGAGIGAAHHREAPKSYDKDTAGGAQQILDIIERARKEKVILPTSFFMDAALACIPDGSEKEKKTVRTRVSNTLQYLREKRKKIGRHKLDGDHMKTFWGPAEAIQGEDLIAPGWGIGYNLEPINVGPY
ncbi:MAG: hypothetical protein KA352_01160 [Flavobacteriales bacterium]|nr:hypothetical protein [Flavobacteriales bacterium]